MSTRRQFRNVWKTLHAILVTQTVYDNLSYGLLKSTQKQLRQFTSEYKTLQSFV